MMVTLQDKVWWWTERKRDDKERNLCELKGDVYTSVVLLTIICCRGNEGGKDQFS